VRRPPNDEEPNFTGAPRGPAVVPGTYTVKLTVGDKTLQKTVEVRLDPSVSVPAADLVKLQEMSLRLRDMQSAANTALRTLDSLKAQLEFIERTEKDRVPDLPKEFTEKLTAYKKQVTELTDKITRPEGGFGFSGRTQLADRIGGLFFTIDAVNAAPTPAQQTYFGEIQTEFRQKTDEVNRFISQTVPQMNETLKRFNAPQLIPGKPVEPPKEGEQPTPPAMEDKH
jgi:hypothetical protein